MPNIELVGTDTYNTIKEAYKRGDVYSVSDADWERLESVTNPTTGALLFQETSRTTIVLPTHLSRKHSDLAAVGLGELDTAVVVRRVKPVFNLTPEEISDNEELDRELAERNTVGDPTNTAPVISDVVVPTVTGAVVVEAHVAPVAHIKGTRIVPAKKSSIPPAPPIDPSQAVTID